MLSNQLPFKTTGPRKRYDWTYNNPVHLLTDVPNVFDFKIVYNRLEWARYLANVVYLFLLIQTMYCVDITTKWSINCVVCWIAWYTMMSYQAFLFHISVSNFSRYARDIILPLLSLAFFLLLELPQFSFFLKKNF